MTVISTPVMTVKLEILSVSLVLLDASVTVIVQSEYKPAPSVLKVIVLSPTTADTVSD